MNTLVDQGARQHLAESTDTIDLLSLIPALTDPKTDREFPDIGRGALVAKLAFTKVR
jgi:hypothetical protein